MKITQILNNNVALIKRGGHEVIVVSKGIGVRKRKGEFIEEKEIEKLYILDSYDMLAHFSYLLAHSDPEDILLTQRIISYAESKLGFKASDSLILTLLDHIDFIFKRAQKQQFVKSPLYWDVKRFYSRYFNVGLAALQMIREHYQIFIPDDEAVALALHFINMESAKGNKEACIKEMRAISDIISIIELHFMMKLDENSTNYMRFFTHLHYFIQRVMEQALHGEDAGSLELYKQVSQVYPKEFHAVQKIMTYVKPEFHTEISIEEETYLMLHLHRVTERQTNDNAN